MKSSLFKSLFALGTVMLACSCSDKPSSSDNGELGFVPCEDVRFLPNEGLVIFTDLSVTDINGQPAGIAVPVPGTTIVIIKDLAGNNLVDQFDLTDPARSKVIAGDPSQCASKVSTCEDARLFISNNKKYLVYPDLSVTDEGWSQVGTATVISGMTVSITDLSGNIMANNVDLASLQLIQGDGIRYTIYEPAYHLKDATGDYLVYLSTLVTDPKGVAIGYADFTTGIIKSADLTRTLTQGNITTQPILLPTSKCVDYVNLNAPSSSSVQPQPASSSSSAYVPPTQSSSSTPIIVSSSSVIKSSSSSTPKSSSSVVVSSSSSAPVNSGCPTIKTKGGASGSGWATRYWDCCKPHCSWPEHAGGNYSKQCTNKGKSENTNWGDGSVCSGGSQMTCTSQIPFTIDGCTDMAFAFAAVPAANGGSCGKCFQLTFDGTGKYSNDANIKKLKGKKLIIMATNVGGDVQQGQFDIMIPGGGVGMFNGCSSMGWGSQGEQYGGLLSECEKESNYKATKYKSCLTEKCNKSFSNDAEAKKGCLFLADWMGAAGNPNHNYVEVECPQVLKDKY